MRLRAVERQAAAALLGTLLLLPPGSAAAAEPAAPEGLSVCAAIAADAERLACYDQLAGRSSVVSTPAAGGPAAVEPPPPALAVVAAPAAPPTPAASAAATAVPVPATQPAAGAAASQGSFGLYPAEHPAAPAVAAALTARILALGRSARGRMTVALEGGALWELDEADPLLSQSDTVTIRRAAFGSFLMETPTRRTHRVQRLR